MEIYKSMSLDLDADFAGIKRLIKGCASEPVYEAEIVVWLEFERRNV
jgi:hypothetical protein